MKVKPIGYHSVSICLGCDLSDQFMNVLTPLTEGIGKTLIIAYKEQTDLLEKTLLTEGCPCQVLRQEPKPEYKNYSPSYLCLLNHRRAWEIAAEELKPTLVVEADFVPVVGFGNLPLPFAANQPDVGVSWLYTCASQLYSISLEGYAEGFSVAMVAYVVTPSAAKCLIELAESIGDTIGSNVYSTWDSSLDNFLRARKFKNYIAFRNYGEHGGLPNLEHYQKGLSKTHRADVLYRKLAFTPMYASNSTLQWLVVRFQARLKGIGRLLAGKFLRISVIQKSSHPFRLISFAFKRQFTLYL